MGGVNLNTANSIGINNKINKPVSEEKAQKVYEKTIVVTSSDNKDFSVKGGNAKAKYDMHSTGDTIKLGISGAAKGVALGALSGLVASKLVHGIPTQQAVKFGAYVGSMAGFTAEQFNSVMHETTATGDLITRAGMSALTGATFGVIGAEILKVGVAKSAAIGIATGLAIGAVQTYLNR